jgi:alkylhydroperoxidase family enzyme
MHGSLRSSTTFVRAARAGEPDAVADVPATVVAQGGCRMLDCGVRGWQVRDATVSSFEALDAEWGECSLEPGPVPADLAVMIKKVSGGSIPEWGARLAVVPWVARGFVRGIEKKIAHMPLALWDLIHFVVSQDNACRYCYGATRTILRILGYPEAAIDRLERDVQLAELTSAETAALRFSRKVSQANPLPGGAELAALADAGFTTAAIGAIAFAAAFSGYGNRVATMFALPPDSLERMLKNPLVRVLRPFLARPFRGKHSPPAPPPVPNDPPFAGVVAALAGSPTAYAVRATVDDALASPILPRRTKLLMFGVIGRALACRHVTQEAERQLAAEGLSPAAVEDIVTNLGSRALDERERLLVPFARETVRYRSASIQQRTRELAARLRIDELVEAAGVAALANSIGRLAVLAAC